MFTKSDYDKLRQFTRENPELDALIQKLLASHRETISAISHEIRNPLTLVYSAVQLISSKHPEVSDFDHWNSMCEDLTYMKQLLDELSAFNNGSSLFLKEFDFRSFMERLVLSFAVTFADSAVEFTSYLAPDLPVIQGDPIKLREAFLNLLRNASEAVKGRGFIRLDAVYRPQDDTIAVTVKDTGCGIPEEHLDDIFTPFVTHKQGGTGLGLPIVKRTVEAHQGTVSVASKAGSGTAFTVTLPAKSAPASPI